MKNENYEVPVVATIRDLTVYKRGEYKGFPAHVRALYEREMPKERNHVSVPLDPDRISGKL